MALNSQSDSTLVPYQELHLGTSASILPSTDEVDARWRKKQSKWAGVLSCIGGVLIYLSLGSLYTFGNMLPYLASYMAYNDNSTDYDKYLTRCDFIFAFTIFGQSIFFPLGGKLGQKIGVKPAIFIGCALQSIFGVLLTYFACGSYIYTYITYGLLFGIGIGLSYPNILVCVMKWYPNNKGFVNGIVLAGFGCSALIFDYAQTRFINPNNHSADSEYGFIFDQDILDQFPYTFLLLGGVFFGMQCIGVLLIQDPFKQEGVSRSNRNDINENTVTLFDESTSLLKAENSGSDDDDASYLAETELERINQDEDSPDVMEVLKDWRFWQLYLVFFIDGMVIVFVSTQWKVFTSSQLGISNDMFLSLMGSISALFNGGGRIVGGLILDATQSFRFTLGINNLILAILLYTWPYCESGNVTMSFVWICLLFGTFAFNFAIVPTIVTWTFGEKNAGINIGLLFTSQVFSSFVSIYVLEDLKSTFGGWEYVLLLIATLQLVGAIVTCAFPKVVVETQEMKALKSKYIIKTDQM